MNNHPIKKLLKQWEEVLRSRKNLLQLKKALHTDIEFIIQNLCHKQEEVEEEVANMLGHQSKEAIQESGLYNTFYEHYEAFEAERKIVKNSIEKQEEIVEDLESEIEKLREKINE